MDYSLQKYGENKYIYSDTDSIKTTLSLEELKQFCKIDDVKLGYWKYEGCYQKAKFIRQKCYIYKEDGEMHIVCSGLTKECYKYVEWEKFKVGFTCKGKLQPFHVKGGIILKETEFTLRGENLKKQIKNF